MRKFAGCLIWTQLGSTEADYKNLTWPDGQKLIDRRKKRSMSAKTTADELPTFALIIQFLPQKPSAFGRV